MISALGEVEEGLTFTLKTGIFHHQLLGLLWINLASYYQVTAAHLLVFQLKVGSDRGGLMVGSPELHLHDEGRTDY